MGSRPKKLAAAVSVTVLTIGPAVALGVPGDFAPAPTSPEKAGTAPISVTSGNLNGDAHADLVVTDFADSSVSILLGDGTGNFTAAATSPEAVGSPSSAAAIADLDGAAGLDVAVPNTNPGNVSILLGDGTGNLTAAATSPETVGPGPLSIAAGKLDGDSDIDLAVSDASNNVSILLNSGAGNFTAAGTSPEATGGTNPRQVVAANLDGDADLDLAVVNRETDNVSILLGDGTGNFTAHESSPVLVGDSPNSLAVGNFDGDGDPDIAVPSRESDNVTVLLGDGTGDFVAAGSSPEPVGENPRSVVAVDLGGSPSTDLAVANADSDNVSILLGDGTGNFTAAGSSPEPTGDEPFSIAAANFGGSPTVDLATANPEGGDVSILINDVATEEPPPGPGAAPGPGSVPNPTAGGGKCRGKAATVRRVRGSGPFVGTAKKDVIVGTSRGDRINGRGGNDLVCAGGGKDVVKGGGGKDLLFGEGGKDKLIGGGGKDKCVGGKGADRGVTCERGKL
jgi:hypothetical protein